MSFAPYAEALGVATNAVMSVQVDSSERAFTVLYTETPTADPDAMLYRARLWMNIADEMEVVENRELCSIGRFQAEVQAIVAKAAEQADDVT